LLLARCQVESVGGLRVAYVSSLAKLGVVAATPELLARLAACDDEANAGELALALARIIGNERSYIQMARSLRSQPGTALAQSVANARRSLPRALPNGSELTMALQAIEDEFARDQIDSAARALGKWIQCLPTDSYRAEYNTILRDASCKLEQYGNSRPEYLLLALHSLTEGVGTS
jgi:hypothetical protein